MSFFWPLAFSAAAMITKTFRLNGRVDHRIRRETDRSRSDGCGRRVVTVQVFLLFIQYCFSSMDGEKAFQNSTPFVLSRSTVGLYRVPTRVVCRLSTIEWPTDWQRNVLATVDVRTCHFLKIIPKLLNILRLILEHFTFNLTQWEC